LTVDNPGTRSAGPAPESAPGTTRLRPAHEFSLYVLGGPDLHGPDLHGPDLHGPDLHGPDLHGPDLDGAAAAAALSGAPSFSALQYSRYKYGSAAAAAAFARALGEAFCACHPELVRAPRLLMTSSPYTYVPTAATALARGLQPVLNAVRAGTGLPPAPFVQVDRIGTAAGDYGTLSAQDRDRRMAANVVSFRRFPPDQVRGAHLLVVDDVRVTGAHQRSVMRASEDMPFEARIFLYIARFRTAGRGFDPVQEDALNHAAVRTLDDLAQIVTSGDFSWNVRVCKFVLTPANRPALPPFLADMPGWFVRDLHRNSSRDGYAHMDLYAPSHQLVRAELTRRPARPRPHPHPSLPRPAPPARLPA
jgi:PRTase ComF-like